MSIEITSNTGGIVTVRVTGKLAQTELVQWQKTIAGLIPQPGKVRLLVVAQAFEGWEKRGDWANVSAQGEMDPHIGKMAIVGDKQWEDLALMFTGKGFRKFPIEFFSPADLAKAQAWLAAD